MNRPIFVVTIGYIIGILWGLYFKISIVFLYLIFFIIYFLSKNFKHTFFRYLKLIIKLNIFITIILSSFISFIIVKKMNNKFEILYQNMTDIKLEVQVIGNKKEKQYYNRYKVKVLTQKYENTYLYINTKEELQYGEIINIEGEYVKPSEARNYKGFNYKEYLKGNKIYGTIKVSKIEKITIKKDIFFVLNELSLKIKENIEKTYNSKITPLILGVMLGDISLIDEETIQNFSESSIIHVLSVSGLHVTYIIYLIEICTQNVFGQKKSRIIEIIMLLIYLAVTGFTLCVVRACIMGILMCSSFLFYRKSDTLNNISVSCLILLIQNPFNLLGTSFIFTYLGTLGVVYFRPFVQDIITNIKFKSIKIQEKYTNLCQKHKSFVESIAVTIGAQLVTLPVIIIKYNFFSFNFIITNFLIEIVTGPIVIVGFIQIIITFISVNAGIAIGKIVQFPVLGLSLTSKIGKKFPFMNFKIATPETYQVIIYYIIIFILYKLYKIKVNKNKSFIEKKLLVIYQKIKSKIILNQKRIFIFFIIIFFSLKVINNIPHNLEIYFIDVGQGDCTIIITPQNKKILIDGGGQETFDVGKNTLVPYLLDRKIKHIDYCIISHFDQDHVRRSFNSFRRIKSKKCNNIKTI